MLVQLIIEKLYSHKMSLAEGKPLTDARSILWGSGPVLNYKWIFIWKNVDYDTWWNQFTQFSAQHFLLKNVFCSFIFHSVSKIHLTHQKRFCSAILFQICTVNFFVFTTHPKFSKKTGVSDFCCSEMVVFINNGVCV